jgi:TolB-like protein/class 3 adenylate cyclase
MERKLAAILAADVVGYSALMEADEAGTFERLRAGRKELFEPEINKHHGRIFKLMGDGLLAEFGSVVDAVECAVTLQRGMLERNASVPESKRIEVRVGINLGEVIVEGDDRYGEGVNVAARLQQLAEPGGICVSEKVSKEVEKKLAFGFEPMGEQRMKNIAEPIACYRVSLHLQPTQTPFSSKDRRSSKPAMAEEPIDLALPDKPSIAVMPFQNMSGDPEQEYFADGIVEEIITALSCVRWLFVIARNSSFTYKGRAVDVKQVGRELGVRYVLEGSVRKAGNRVRIIGQLIDTATAAHLWAERFEGGLENVFDLQDQVTTSVVGAIAPKLQQAEIERAKRKPTDSLDAYDYYLRGLASFHAIAAGRKEAVNEALPLFDRAIELDPEFPSAYGMASWCHVLRRNYGWVSDGAREIAEAERLARRATRLGKDDPIALFTGGFALAHVADHLDVGAGLIDQALTLDPNLAAAWHLSGWVRIWQEKPGMAIEHIERAIRLSPHDPLMFIMQNGTAVAHFLAGRYDDASAWSERALRNQTDYLSALRVAAASHAYAGRPFQAQKAMARIRQIDPELRTSNLADVVPFRGDKDIARYIEGLRQAGLPA